MTKKDKAASNTSKLHIWDKPFRAKGLQERNPAFECFLKYRDMGANRSLVTLSKQENIDYQKLCNWSSNYQWNDRIKAMLNYENEEKKKANARIKKKAMDMINERLETKNELIGAIFDILQENVSRYAGTELDFKEFASLFNLAMKLESINIEDIANIHDVEQIFKDSGVDANKIQAVINNYSMVLTSENNNAIDVYEMELKDEKY